MAVETETQQFEDTKTGWAKRLSVELKAAKDALKEFHEQGDKALAAYLDEREAAAKNDSHWTLFTADTQTKEAILFGNPPRADVTRRFADYADDTARVGAEILERNLNEDIEGEDDSFTQAIGYAHFDREVPGLGFCRIRYVMGETVKRASVPAKTDPVTGAVLAPEVPEVETRPNEAVETDWVHWKDVAWNPCRVWHEVGIIFFKVPMTQDELVKKFGPEAIDVPLNTKKQGGVSQSKEGKDADPWSRADVYEVWVKAGRQVFFFVDGYATVLTPVGATANANGSVSDPLGLTGFWPCPKPMMANVTTTKLVPKPDYWFAKDLYAEVNALSTRITLLEQAVRVAGVYDATNKELNQLLDDSYSNKMIGVERWALFGEKGGIRGAVDWFPLDQIVAALSVLREERNELIEGLRQVTGMADIMRGQAQVDGATATETRVKARFGSVRMERRQKELARFASDLQRLRAEVMCKHFAPSTLLARCNCENTPDADKAPEAVKMIQSDVAKFRIEVKPEVISLTDFDALKQERTDVIGSLSQYLTAVGPLAAQMPGSAPFLMEILQWMLSGLRGSAEIEGVLDRAIAQAKAAAAAPQQPAQPDPKLEAAKIQMQSQQMKANTDMQKEQFKHAAKLEEIGAEVQADDQREQSQARWNTTEAAQKAAIQHAFKPPALPGQKPGGP